MFKKWIISLLLAFSLSSFAAFAADKININSATADELQLLDGVGPSTADAIVQYREQNGTFSSVDDLVNIKGIGEKKVAALAEKVTVTD
ncbi:MULTISPECIES: helix-hairpin-helix domain-containing protein [unclassified Methylophaga]|uniref:ComEA family DNA-binding protein n=1 Tax=unclassified Methylophaga TaxID=2629249 RepID=UPI000C97C438|nr:MULTISPECIES: helix-hairpin-helix domain-containing protein [unclassified Methylophaga]MAK67034.1 competence protein ComEA [Methylophaga sp.]MAY18071.1 competence protein ComEA [Methylophaga sp.]MBN45496.1 competence protein ComEA [Methylophaga sp.]HAO26183.1 competence protein ComEA [Methylophaga sp.]HCD06146.1 competence protein ComEA [Methylophaga sp.]